MTYDLAARAPPSSPWGRGEPGRDAESQALPRRDESETTCNQTGDSIPDRGTGIMAPTVQPRGAGGSGIKFVP